MLFESAPVRSAAVRSTCVSLLAVLIFISPLAGSAATVEEETQRRLDQIRSIEARPDAKPPEEWNKRMDEMWKYFTANKEAVLPVLRSRLAAELKNPKPSQLMLLDTGYYLYTNGDASDREVAKQALFTLNTEADIVSRNFYGLFRFAHAVACAGDPKIVGFIDKTFLPSDREVYNPDHSLGLDSGLLCAFLYGASGPNVEEHLRGMLGDPRSAQRIMEVLIYVGSPASVPEVKRALMASRDYETLDRAAELMMSLGGPEGRAALLGIDPKEFDAESQEEYPQIREAAEQLSFELLQKRYSGFSNGYGMTDEDLKQHLAKIYEKYGFSQELESNPLPVLCAALTSNLSKDYLVGELRKIRSRMFHRVSDETLSEVELINGIINALYYRDK